MNLKRSQIEIKIGNYYKINSTHLPEFQFLKLISLCFSTSDGDLFLLSISFPWILLRDGKTLSHPDPETSDGPKPTGKPRNSTSPWGTPYHCLLWCSIIFPAKYIYSMPRMGVLWWWLLLYQFALLLPPLILNKHLLKPADAFHWLPWTLELGINMNSKADLETPLFELSHLYFQTNSFPAEKHAMFMCSFFGHTNSLGFIYSVYIKRISSEWKKLDFFFVSFLQKLKKKKPA